MSRTNIRIDERALKRELEKQLSTEVRVRSGDTQDTLAARISVELRGKGVIVNEAGVRQLAREALDSQA